MLPHFVGVCSYLLGFVAGPDEGERRLPDEVVAELVLVRPFAWRGSKRQGRAGRPRCGLSIGVDDSGLANRRLLLLAMEK
jgi:hypothetical protein